MTQAATTAILERASAGVRGLKAYEPGMPIEELQRELAIDDVIKLASNENPLGPSPKVVKAIADSVTHNDLGLYPDGGGFRLKRRIAKFWDIDARRITLGNGSSDILDFMAHIFLASGGRAALFSQYAFAVYPIATQAEGGRAAVAPARPLDDAVMPYGHDLRAFEAALAPDVALIFIANPNNPTGTWLPPAEIERFLERVPAQVPVVLDEAYYEYQDPELHVDSRRLLDRFPNLVVARTFSKVYGLASLRVGYGLSSPELADLMNRIRPPFNVNSLGLLAAEAALDDQAHVTRSVALNRSQRARLQHDLTTLGLRCLPSQANFVCFDCGRDSAPIHRGLLEAGVIVRPMASYSMPHFLRVTVGTEDQNTRFLGTLKKVISR
ncbi:MAG: histidinol-phosphate transaminase [Nevskiaceae bacterium]|nr:MAG: histidinol-phosphate transaminase [Nevskiaceae bacterium]TBR74780.1 MAG: histidinol-phosphate transaminase [Nevskiaceae bacterium]